MISNAWTTEPIPPYNKVLRDDSGHIVSWLEKGTHTVKVVARHEFGPYGIKIGESETITIKVK